LWVGNVEIHLKSSDWYAHHHEVDDAYNTVILHVVWVEDCDVFRNDNTKIPTLELKSYLKKELLVRYQNLLNHTNKKFINCEKDVLQVDHFVRKSWLERLFFERLEEKTKLIKELLVQYNNNWEYVLFIVLLKNFGLKMNGESFLSMQTAFSSESVAKLKNNSLQLESALLGLSGILDGEDCKDPYYKLLKEEFQYIKNKFNWNTQGIIKPKFFKLRPPNFPTIRLSQFAALYSTHQNLFSNIISETSLEDLHGFFNVSASEYWDTHYTFGKESKKSKKKITPKFLDLLVVNTILPFKFLYAKSIGKEPTEALVKIASEMSSENNTVIGNFKNLKLGCASAKESQAFLQLYNRYCTKNKCLQCAIGTHLLKGNT